MSKTLRILCPFLLMIAAACGGQSEVTVPTTIVTTTTTFVDRPPPTAPTTTTTTTTILVTTTTSQESTYQGASFSTDDVWDELAECEDNDDPTKGPTGWASNTGNGYEGGLQFSSYTWDAYVASGKPYALIGYPDAAYNATREQQIQVGIRVRDGVKGSSNPYLNPQGWGAWPSCRHVVGV